jgi:Family of unknown function (DUF5681)
MNPNGDPSKAIPEPASEVGYGRPPEATRFRKGTSGNPKGRPRGSLNVATLFIKTLRERVVINENGQRKKVTKLEAALKQLVNKSATGDLRAMRQLVELAREAEAKQNTSGTQSPPIGELDQEVIDGIVRRFEGTEAQIQEAQEANDVDDQRS